MKRAHVVAVLTLELFACASSRSALNSSEQAELSTAMSERVSFTIPREMWAEAWERAQTFFTQYLRRQFISVSSKVLVTDQPSSASPAYLLMKTPVFGGFQIEFAFSASDRAERDADEIAHIWAHYVRTGRVLCKSCIDCIAPFSGSGRCRGPCEEAQDEEAARGDLGGGGGSRDGGGHGGVLLVDGCQRVGGDSGSRGAR